MILLLAPRVSVMQFSTSPGFIHTATSSTLFATLRQAIRLRARVECVLRGDSKQSGHASAASTAVRVRVCLTRPANFFSSRTTFSVIVGRQPFPSPPRSSNAPSPGTVSPPHPAWRKSLPVTGRQASGNYPCWKIIKQTLSPGPGRDALLVEQAKAGRGNKKV